nr:hypothetical protein BHI3_07300 [Bacteriovorax sp. HI3]
MLRSLINNSLFILACTLFVACGKSTEEEVKDAVLSANILLSRKECQPAIDLLEGMGRQNKNANYLKALSSAYACRAGYSTITFFADDISKTASPAPLGGMTLYSTSQVTATSPLTDDSKFRDLQTAIDILAYAGGIASTVEPSSAERLKYFSVNQAGDINTQLAFMVLVQTGKLMKVYSDANSSGVKGGGSGSNNCFTDYTTTDASTVQAYLGLGETGACTSANSSHPQLALGVSGRRKRLCEGVVLLNAILDLLPNIVATAGGGDLDAIKDMTNDIQEKKDELASMDSSYTATMNVLSQTNCETSTDITEVTLSSYYAIFFESLVK